MEKYVLTYAGPRGGKHTIIAIKSFEYEYYGEDRILCCKIQYGRCTRYAVDVYDVLTIETYDGVTVYNSKDNPKRDIIGLCAQLKKHGIRVY